MRVSPFLLSFVFFLLFSIAFGGAASAAVVYVAPIEADGGRIPDGGRWATPGGSCTREEPCAIADFLEQRPQDGGELVLLDGTYRGSRSMLRLPPDTGGSEAQPLVIRAENDGRVLVDAGTTGSALQVQGSWVRVEGIDFRSQSHAAGVSGLYQLKRGGARPQHIILRRVVVYKDPIPCQTDPCILSVDKPTYEAVTAENMHVLGIAGADHVLLEDVAAFGRGRKVIQFYKSTHVTCRRCWVRQEGNWPWIRSSNLKSITPVYRTLDTRLENVLATVGGSPDTRIQPAAYDDRPQIVSTDAQPLLNPDGSHRDAFIPPGRDHSAVGLRIRDSIVYALPTARLRPGHGIRIGAGGRFPNKGLKDARLYNVVVWLPADSKGNRLALNDCDDETAPGRRQGCDWSYLDTQRESPLIYDQVTLRGGRGDSIHGDWAKPTDVDAARKAERGLDIYTPGGPGASICFRVVDGLVTDEPLWPWPMQERIRAATEASLWETADIQADLASIFAEVPSVCLAQPGDASA